MKSASANMTLMVVVLLAVMVVVSGCSECSRTAMLETNRFRGNNGKQALSFSRLFYNRCKRHSREMASRNQLFHTSLGDGVRAENVAYRSSGGSVGKLMVQQWIDSPEHRRNMLGPYRCFATYIYISNGKAWGTQMFGTCNDPSGIPQNP